MEKRRNRKELGSFGENLAYIMVKEAGLQVVERNYRCTKGEIDLIAREQDWLVFIEVRTRSSGEKGWAQESIDLRKRKKLLSLSLFYLLEKGYKTYPKIRFDLFAINLNNGEPETQWLKGIFS